MAPLLQKHLSINPAAIAEICRKYGLREFSIFGSVLRDDFRADSDVDVLIEFEPGKTVDFFTFIDMQDELSDLLGYEVDLNTPNFLSRYFRDKVVQNARVLYDFR